MADVKVVETIDAPARSVWGLLSDFGGIEVHALHAEHGEKPFPLFGGTDLTGYGIPGFEIEQTDLGGRNIDVIGTGQVAVVGRTQETVAVREYLQRSGGIDLPASLGELERVREQVDQYLLDLVGALRPFVGFRLRDGNGSCPISPNSRRS